MAILYILIMWIIVSIILIAIWVNGLNKHMIEVLQSDITLLMNIHKLTESLNESLDKIQKENEKENSKTEKALEFFGFPTKWLVTYQLKNTHEIFTDIVVNFTDDPRDVLEYIAKNFFDDQEAELISITRL